MKKEKKFNKRILFILGLTAMLLVAGIQTVFAEEYHAMPDIDGDTTLAISMIYHDVDENNAAVETPIQGVEFTAYKVADLTVANGSAKYTLAEGFTDSGIGLDWGWSESASEQIAAAKAFADYVEAADPKPSNVGVVTTLADGTADFGKVDPGMYLFIQTNATGAAIDYTTLEPFVISAPKPEVGDGRTTSEGNIVYDQNTSWVYNVAAAPKSEIMKYETPPPPNEPPTDDTPPPPNDPPPTEDDTPERRVINTGDATRIAIWAVLMAAAIVAIIVIKRKNKKQ